MTLTIPGVADADMTISGIENIRAMPGRIHPSLHDRGARVVIVRDILAASPVGIASRRHPARESGSAGLMAQSADASHRLSMSSGGSGELGVGSESRQAVIGALLVGEANDIGGEGLLNLGEGGGWGGAWDKNGRLGEQQGGRHQPKSQSEEGRAGSDHP